MKKVFFLLAIILLVSGQVMCTSCGSSNDEYENKNQPTPPDDNEDPEDPGEEPDTKSLTTDLKNLSGNTSLKCGLALIVATPIREYVTEFLKILFPLSNMQ